MREQLQRRRGLFRRSGHIPFTPGAQAVLEKGIRVAAELRLKWITPAVLLVALLEVDRSEAADRLQQVGVDSAALSAAARTVAASGGPDGGAGTGAVP